MKENQFQFFYKNLNSINPLTDSAWRDLKSFTRAKNFKAGDFLVLEGQKSRYCYFLEEGIVRVFYNNAGTEYNKTFFIPGTFPTTLTALLTDTSSKISLQALTPTKVVQFSYIDFRQLFDQHRCLERLFLKIMEQIWIKKERHDIHMVTNDATTNYLIFQKEFPGVEQLIPQYHIASYLGVTPIQLSRIRAKLAKS
ncbi:Crp/Fnr family transcriptional regulator [Flexithrix dorotheae]|uniref:Crp/Fnr family transcriptional regulator n=1 Tax=Flexithrix dorotheae TaxID=70993 RepID=UPI00036E78D1|nr:Crp/Fnr family transcriptional regulator [Flexithrix dorotheae]